MKLSQLSLADYNKLDSIPVINQDLSASGFTPVANTYYRHTGATTDAFTQGVIYLYDTAYHKLGESGSGGGRTLNKYTVTLSTNGKLSSGKVKLINRIISNAKSYVLYRGLASQATKKPVLITYCSSSGSIEDMTQLIITYATESYDSFSNTCIIGYNEVGSVYKTSITYKTDGVTVERSTSGESLFMIYCNDTEIT